MLIFAFFLKKEKFPENIFYTQLLSPLYLSKLVRFLHRDMKATCEIRRKECVLWVDMKAQGFSFSNMSHVHNFYEYERNVKRKYCLKAVRWTYLPPSHSKGKCFCDDFRALKCQNIGSVQLLIQIKNLTQCKFLCENNVLANCCRL